MFQIPQPWYISIKLCERIIQEINFQSTTLADEDITLVKAIAM